MWIGYPSAIYLHRKRSGFANCMNLVGKTASFGSSTLYIVFVTHYSTKSLIHWMKNGKSFSKMHT